VIDVATSVYSWNGHFLPLVNSRAGLHRNPLIYLFTAHAAGNSELGNRHDIGETTTRQLIVVTKLTTDPAAHQAEEDPTLPTQEYPSNMDNAAADDRKKDLFFYIIFAGLAVAAGVAYTIKVVVDLIQGGCCDQSGCGNNTLFIGKECFFFLLCIIYTVISATVLIRRANKARRGDDSIMKPCCPSAFLKWALPVVCTLLAVLFFYTNPPLDATNSSFNIWLLLWLSWAVLAGVGYCCAGCNPGMKALVREEGLPVRM
jgi:hypothetical protein